MWEQALRDDWNENHAFDRRPNQLDRLNVIDTVFTLTELYRFCARLGKGWDGTAAVRMRVSLHGTKDRILWINDPARDGFHADNITRSLEIDAADEEYGLLDLIEGADALARTAAVRVFRAFGWEPQPGVIEGMQGELLRR